MCQSPAVDGKVAWWLRVQGAWTEALYPGATNSSQRTQYSKKQEERVDNKQQRYCILVQTRQERPTLQIIEYRDTEGNIMYWGQSANRLIAE